MSSTNCWKSSPLHTIVRPSLKIMIRSIEIKNLRGIQEGKLENLTPLTILVGPNGCGKSTILDALLIGVSPTPCEAVSFVVLRRDGVKRGTDWLFHRKSRDKSAGILCRSEDATAHHTDMSLDVFSPESERIVECSRHLVTEPEPGTIRYVSVTG